LSSLRATAIRRAVAADPGGAIRAVEISPVTVSIHSAVICARC